MLWMQDKIGDDTVNVHDITQQRKEKKEVSPFNIFSNINNELKLST